MKNKKILFRIFIFLLFLFIIINVNATSITLISPQNNTNFTNGSEVNFNCSISAENGINKLEFLSNINKEANFQIIKTFNKGSFNEESVGNNLSVNYYNQYLDSNINLNPTYFIDGDGDDTCDGDYDPCNMGDPSGGSGQGGYWHPTNLLASARFTMTLNDTFLINNFYLNQHTTFYANHSSLEYSLDGNNWTVIFNKTTTAIINETFSPIYAKYLRFISNELASPNNIYVYYVSVTGQLLNSSTPFNSSLNYNYSGLSGGTYKWNCKAYTNTENLTALNNYTFLINGTRIDWINPTPNSGTQSTYITVKTEVNSDYNAYSFYNRDNSIIGWWTFDNSSNRLQSVNNEWGSNFTKSGTPTYPSSIFGEGVLLGNNDYIDANNSLIGNNNNGFTLVWSMNLSNASAFNTSTDLIYNTDKNSVGGFSLRFQSENSTDWRIYILMYNSTGYSNIAPKLTFPKSYITDFKKYALSVDVLNQRYNLYINGNLISTATSSENFNFYDPGNDLRFVGKSYFNVLIDDIFFLNISVTNEEGKLLSNYSKINNFAMDYASDKNVTLKPYGYDTEGSVTTTETRTFNFLESPIINYVHLFNNNNETLLGYCRATLNATSTENISHVMQYSLDNETFINLTKTYQENNETYAVIGDSMSNSYSDWIGYLTNNFNVSDATIPIYAISGNKCSQVYVQLIDNVTNGTTNLFSTCGVNGGIPTTNTNYWEDIYNTSKAKNISKIYMTTMPPWDVINTYDNATAQTKCDLQKSQNQWLIDFASDKDDLEVIDLWTFYHDTSGVNKTDCGWRTDITYSNDGIHPNSLGNEYWANEYWKLFNEWSNNTFKVSITPNQNGTYYFRCYTDGERNSTISSMGELMVTDVIAPTLNIIEPANNSILSFPESVNVTLNVTANDSFGISSYWYNIDGGINVTFNQTIGITFSIANGHTESHIIYVFVNDTYNNVKLNSTYITIQQTGNIKSSSTTNSGGSSYTSSFWKNTYRYDNSNLNLMKPLIKTFKEAERIKIKILNKSYYVGVVRIFSNTVTLNISANSQQEKIQLGDTSKFDIDNDSYYDLKIYVSNIQNNRTNLAISYLHEKIPEKIKDNNSFIKKNYKPKKNSFKLLILGIVLFFITLITYIIQKNWKKLKKFIFLNKLIRFFHNYN